MNLLYFLLSLIKSIYPNRLLAPFLSSISLRFFKRILTVLLKYLLEHEEFIKIDDLCEELYVSRKTISSNLKRVEEILKRYSIQLIRKPNYGIKVVGKEFDFRLCIANFTMNKKFIVEHKDKFNDQVGIISIVVSRKIKKNNIKMSSVAFQNLIVHIYIAIERIKEECYVAIEKNYLEEIILFYLS